MKQKILALSILLSASMMAEAIEMKAPNQQDVDWYYSLGGEYSVSPPLSHTTNSIVLGGAASWGAGASCGAFDPTLGLANTLNGIKSGIDSMQQQVIGAATSAIASLPMLLLQRASPGLYDMFMSSSASAQSRLSLATKNCETAMAEIGRGENPYEDWINVSRTEDWKKEMGGGEHRSASSDVLQAKDNVEKKNGKDGVTWADGTKKGGKGQAPIRMPTDIVKAGYNLNLNRSASSSSPAPQNGSRMVELWPKPLDIELFSRSLLGEEPIWTHNNRQTKSLPRRGLTFEISEESKAIMTKIEAIISGDAEISLENLKDISAPNILITPDIIHALRSFSSSRQTILKNKLTQEIATARTIEKALLVRRALLTGQQEPNIHASGVGYKESEKYIKQLNDDINNVLFELEISKKLALATGKTIRELSRYEAAATNTTTVTPSRTPTLPVSGALPK